MTVTLQHEDALTPVTIITSYAPHKGHTATERKQHWDKLEQTILEVPKSHMQIWRSDANGQLVRGKLDKKYNHIVGPFTYNKETETGNGQRLLQTCIKNNLIPMNTWKRSKLIQQEKEQLKKCSTPTESKYILQQIHKQKAITWTSINNKINRQIDYIVINQRFRNSVKRTQTITGWKENMQQENNTM